MLPPTAGASEEQRIRPEMAFQERRDVQEITRDIIREARFASRDSVSPTGKREPVKTIANRRHVSAKLVKLTYVKMTCK